VKDVDTADAARPVAAHPAVVRTDGLPGWLEPVRRAAESARPEQLSSVSAPPEGGRPSAVLILFGEGPDGPDLLLTERAHTMRAHAGQPAFPGGSIDPEDGDPAGDGPLRAALREAEEETGLNPDGVQVFAVLPELYLPVSDFLVSPVLGWWREPSPVAPVDPAEVASVFRVPVRELTDPANRLRLRAPSGWTGPAFLVEGCLVWGFTAGVIDRILHLSGWERHWDTTRVLSLEEANVAL
jgi:8-oxo-dGTP pyrophosphatase MutT (NUDIX family)